MCHKDERPQQLLGSHAAGSLLGTKIEREMERALREFVRIKSVSADPSLREESYRGAKFLARLLESLGAEIKICKYAPQPSADCCECSKCSRKIKQSDHKGGYLTLLVCSVCRPVEDKNPIVLGRIGTCPDRPTITMYGTQPARQTHAK